MEKKAGIGKKVGIIGLGSMGGMIARKLLESGIVDSGLMVSNRSREKAESLAAGDSRVTACEDNRAVASLSSVLFLCVKPAEMKGVLDEIRGSFSPDSHLISINASVMFRELESACPDLMITKCVPSVTAEVGESVTLFCHNRLVGEHGRTDALRLLSALGTTEEIREDELGIVSEITSCMPGFVSALFRVIAREAASHMSVESAAIERMLMRTVHGSAAFFLAESTGFDRVIERVATKGGITEEGVKVIDAAFPPVVREIFAKTIEKRALVTKRAIGQFAIGSDREPSAGFP